MKQRVFRRAKNGIEARDLPSPRKHVLPGLPWGRLDVLFTPAYWAAQVWQADAYPSTLTQRFGENFREEVVACLLCTHGVPSQVGLAAFTALKTAGLLAEKEPRPERIESVLRKPLSVEGRQTRYRFPRVKSLVIHSAMARLSDEPLTKCPFDLRAQLQNVSGIGPKIASWIVRNWLQTEEVAVIDIHVYRAGLKTGFFDGQLRLDSHYALLEQRYLTFARAVGATPSKLDYVIWSQMRLASAARMV